eukprot:SAG11_NODE_1904_length_4088_cov_3.427676_9_plen_104_part_00
MWEPPPNVATALALVGDNLLYAACADSIWSRLRHEDVPSDGSVATAPVWERRSRSPTSTTALCHHEPSSRLFALDEYHALWFADRQLVDSQPAGGAAAAVSRK